MVRVLMRQSEVIKETGATRDEIRYFERKGYVQPKLMHLKQRTVKNYSEREARLIGLIVKYRRERFELDAAYEKAKEELARPRLV